MNDVPRGLLRETLRGRMTPDPSGSCVDSETLAAWSEETLNARERDAVERHCADCARCQALLAAMARTAPLASPSRWWRPSTFGWLAPLAAAAAAVLLWINLSPSSIERVPGARDVATSVTARDAALPAPPPSPAVPVPERTAAAPADRPRAGARGGRTSTRTAPAAPRLADEAIDAITQMKGAPQTPNPLAGGKGAPAGTRDAVAVPPAGAVAGGLPPRDEPLTQASKIQPSEKSGFAGTTADRVMRRALVPVEIVSPDASVRWRILSAGQVARSIDRGVTWQTQSTGASIMFTAGAAPAPAVCWLVGPGGAVVLSTDGRTWQRLAFPDASDLIAVRATDAATATVTAADGRTLTTSDGGKSWRQP